MAHTKGRLGMLAVSTNGSSYNDVGGIRSIDFNKSHETTDDTDFDSAGKKEFDYGESSATLSVTFLYDESDVGQDAIRTSDQGQTLLYYRYRPYENAGSEQMIAQGVITSLKHGNQRNAKVECSLEVQLSGTITYSTQ